MQERTTIHKINSTSQEGVCRTEHQQGPGGGGMVKWEGNTGTRKGQRSRENRYINEKTVFVVTFSLYGFEVSLCVPNPALKIPIWWSARNSVVEHVPRVFEYKIYPINFIQIYGADKEGVPAERKTLSRDLPQEMVCFLVIYV